MSIPQLSETTLRRHANAQPFEQGEAYYRAGAVGHLRQRGNTLQAAVEGNEVEPYTVHLTFDEGGLTTAHCSCAYSFEGWCKHIVATALVCLHQPELIEERPALECLLERLDLSQTRGLVQELVTEQPSLMETVDRYVQRLAEPTPPVPAATPPRRTPVDPAPFRRAVQQILRNAVRDWESGRDDDSINEDLQALIEQCYRNGGYDADIDYRCAPVPPLAADDEPWAADLLRGQGRR